MVILFRKYMTSHGPRTLHEGPATPTKWKSESVTELPMNLLIWEGAKKEKSKTRKVAKKEEPLSSVQLTILLL